MKKLFAMLMALCLLFTACAAVADMEIPDWNKMPNAVIEDENTTVDEAAFQGEWVLNVAFAGTEYVDEQTLAGTYDYNFMPYMIADGKISQDYQNEYGEFVTMEAPYTFEAGQLQGTGSNGRTFAVDLLEDGNIVLSVFYAGESGAVTCLSVFLTHPAGEA